MRIGKKKSKNGIRKRTSMMGDEEASESFPRGYLQGDRE